MVLTIHVIVKMKYIDNLWMKHEPNHSSHQSIMKLNPKHLHNPSLMANQQIYRSFPLVSYKLRL